MADRIKLTEDRFREVNFPIEYILNATKEEKQQILDDYDLVSNLGVNPRQLIQEWKAKLDDYKVLKPMYSKLEEKLDKITKFAMNLSYSNPHVSWQLKQLLRDAPQDHTKTL